MTLAAGADWLSVMTEHTASARALVVFASTHGHTATIAARIADTLREQGLETDLRDVALSERVDPTATTSSSSAARCTRSTTRRRSSSG